MHEPAPVVGAIIQARTNSTRLPGKAMLDIAGRSMVGRVVDRVRLSTTVQHVIVAVPDGREDDALAEHVRALGATLARGSEHDVLDRYYQAARAAALDVVVRITSDCPLLDPDVLDQVVQLATAPGSTVEYAANTLQRTFPRGLDVEVAPFEVLARLWREATAPHERQHVFPYIHDRPGQFRLAGITHPVDRSGMRWTVDTPEDLAFARTVCAALPATYRWLDVVRLLDAHPEWLAINADVEQKSAHAN